MKKYLFILVLNLIASTASGQTWGQLNKIIASDFAANDYFGRSVAISDNYAIVGSILDDEDPNGLNTIDGAGSAYIIKKNLGIWSEYQKFCAPVRASYDQFGYSVSISGDYAVVGAVYEDEDENEASTLSDAGSVYIYKNNSGNWEFYQKIVAPDRAANDNFGCAVSISGDYIVVGAKEEDHDENGNNYIARAGSAYVFKNISGVWTFIKKLVAFDRASMDFYGFSVALSTNYIIIGAYYGDNDSEGNNPISNAGCAYIYKNNSDAWTFVKKITAGTREVNDVFGWSVSMTDDFAVVSAKNEDEDYNELNTLDAAGSAYIFKNNSDTWNLYQKITPNERTAYDYFGSSVSISGDYIVVGAEGEDEDADGANTYYEAGAAYIFYNNSGTWTQKQKIVAYDRDGSDNFGASVSISGGALVVGCAADENNALSYSGSAYIFSDPEVFPVELTDFSVTELNGKIFLNWQTATEVNNYGFEIERAINISNDLPLKWEKIGFVEGHGNSNFQHDYQFIDEPTFQNVISLAYRLKQIDTDGKIEFSKVVEIEFVNLSKHILSQNYPNPFNPSTIISYQIPEASFVTLKVYDVLGREVATLVNEEKTAGVYNVECKMYNVSSGIYFYTLKSGSFSETKEMILLR